MNNTQGPPFRYPNSHESTAEIYRTRGSPNATRLPSYGSRGTSPPGYRNADDWDPMREIEQEKLAPRTKTLIVRVLSSIFIVTIMAVVIAAVVTKIQDMQKNYGLGDDPNGDANVTTTASAAMTMTTMPNEKPTQEPTNLGLFISAEPNQVAKAPLEELTRRFVGQGASGSVADIQVPKSVQPVDPPTEGSIEGLGGVVSLLDVLLDDLVRCLDSGRPQGGQWRLSPDVDIPKKRQEWGDCG